MNGRIFPTAAAALALLCSCGTKTLALPDDPVDRAATCGVVAAAVSRMTTSVDKTLPFGAQLNILDYAMRGGVSGNDFSPEAASQVSHRMQALQGKIIEGKWRDLKPACYSAFPEVQKADVTLPAERFTAELGCDSLADFIDTALRNQTGYGNELANYRMMRSKLNLKMAAEMKRRAGTDITAQRAERHRATAATLKQGSLPAIMTQCTKSYG